MRKLLIAGNWKMYKTISEAITLVNTIKAGVHSINGVDIVVCPPFTALDAMSKSVERTSIELGAQNMYSATEGAYTGEISPQMIKDIGCRYVILGHSERRGYFKETDDMVNKKVCLALDYNLNPIVCIGETLEQREQSKTKEVVRTQFENSLKGLTVDQMNNIIIAYEPVWAIGTGKNATPQQAEEVHKYIRQLIVNTYDRTVSENVRILYGGSVKPDNCGDLMQKGNIDGALVGGASLKAESFIQIIAKAKEISDNNK
ncbi:MAG: triose-phosphate isomerase [Candidatus Omnitrophica bacterium]|nr:triose-phosphate isomerase [Candidatus Omnitrophota bacterium]